MKPLEIARGVCGVYKITNLVNSKCYVGCSVDVRLRWIDHRARRNRNHHLTISRAFRKYGIDSFSFELLEECAPEALSEREMFWVAELKPAYNRTLGGRGPSGMRLTEEARARISDKAKEQWRKMSPEERRRRVASNLTGPHPGHKRSWEMRQRISATLKGRVLGPQSQERKDAMRASIRKRGAAWGAARWKQIAQVNNKGRIVWYWASTTIAAAHFGIHPSTINRVIKGHRKTAAGFRWAAADVQAGLPIPQIFYEQRTV